MFSIQELVTATEQRLAIPVVVVDNGGYARDPRADGRPRHRPQAVDLYRPDIPALARADRCPRRRGRARDDIGRLAAKALAADRPTVIHHVVA